jgi:hypothetical protein
MRYQERIYIQNDNSAVRNKDILNVNMSSDICIFESPLFNLSGASKIDCTGTTGTSYVVNTATTIPLTFQFTANTETFTANSATFKYEIYKYSPSIKSFITPPVYQSGIIVYSAISGTSAITQNIPISGLSLDGDYLVKGYYMYPVCTEFMNRLGKTIDTLTYRGGTMYNLYNPKLDYYFIALKAAEKPQLVNNGSNTIPANQLFQQVILPNVGETTIIITTTYVGFFVLTLNGLVLSPNLDYTYVGNVVTLSSATVTDDIITIIYTTAGGNNLVGDNILINTPVVSGTSDNQGSNKAYFDTSTGKYEIYTSVTPANNGNILVMLNGVTLANGIDFYQSISNPKRIILEGDLQLGDVITIVYFPQTNVVNNLNTNNPVVAWSINTPPQLSNGYFSLEVSNNVDFSTYYYSGHTDYVANQSVYTDTFVASGEVGTHLYYRVKNQKNYNTLCGDIITTIAYSDILPITISTNAINTY